MTDAPGANTFLHPGAKFTAQFPTVGVAIGGLDTTGTMLVPASIDGSGQLKVSAAFTGTITASNPSVSTTNQTTPVQATLVGGTDGTKLQAVNVAAVNATTYALDVNIAAGSITASNPSVGTTNTATPAQATLLGGNVNGTMQALNAVAVNATTFALDVNIATSNVAISATNPSVGTTGTTAPTSATELGLVIGGNLQNWVGVIATTINATAYVARVDLSSMGGTAVLLGSTTMANSMPVVIANDQLGALGQETMASSVPVVIASDQSALTAVVSGTVAVTGSITASNPSVSTTNQTTPVQATLIGGTDGTKLQAVNVFSVNATTYALDVNIAAGSINASNPSVGTTATTAPVQATELGLVVGTNLQNWNGVNIVNATTFAARSDLSSVNGTVISMGQAVMATSLPVVIASNQSNLTTVLGAAIPAGSNAIGTVTALQGGASWSANITQISGTAITMGQKTMATSVPVVIASDQSTLTAVVSGSVTAAISGTPNVNVTAVGGAALTLGQKVMATSLPVVIASDQSNLTTVLGAALPAGTNAIGTVTVTGTVSVSGTSAFNLTQILGSTVVTAAAGVLKVGISGNLASTLDVPVAGGVPVSGLVGAGVYNQTQPVPAVGSAIALQLDQAANQRVFPGSANFTSASFTSGSAAGATTTIMTNSGAGSILVQLYQGNTLTAGSITFQGSYDGVNFVTPAAYQVLDPTTFSTIGLPYTLQASTNKPFLLLANGFQNFQIKLQTAISGTGIVTSYVSLLPHNFGMQLMSGANIIGSLAANQSVNVAQIGAVNYTLGQKVMATSMPVVIASDQSNLTTVLGAALPAGSNAIGTVSITGALPAGSNAIGTVTVTGTPQVNLTAVGGSVIVLGSTNMAKSLPVTLATDQATVTVNVGQILGATVATAASGALAIGGIAASGAAVAGNPLLQGGRAQTGEPSAVTNGQAIAIALDLVGRQIITPFANKENWTAAGTTSATTTGGTLFSSINATTRWYLTAAQFGNTSSSTIVISFNDAAASSQFVVPSGGGNNVVFNTPLIFGLNSAVIYTCSAGVSTAYINVQGYKGT